MSVRVGGATPQSFTADFELQGGAPSGQLLLLSPLGTTLARLSWNPSHALLERPGQTNASFFSLAEMAQAATGVDIPVHQLFDWLAGRPTPATDWEVDLGALDAGRLNARRTDPNLQAELRLVLSR